MNPCIRSFVVIVGIVFIAHVRSAAQGSVTLDVDATATGTPAPLVRSQNGLANVGLIYSGATKAAATIQTSAFVSENGSISLDIFDCENTKAIQSQPYTVNLIPDSVLHVCFLVPVLPANSKYTGKLIVSLANAAPYVRALTLTPPTVPAGTLVLDQNAVTRTVRRSLWPAKAGAPQVECSVRVREKTGNIALEGLTARLEQVSAPDRGFDLHNNVSFALNGRPVDDFTSLSSGTSSMVRTIPIGGQSEIKLGVHDLEAGDYTALLRFTASNSTTEESSQRLQLTIHVRDSLVWALLCLIAALILSFIATKVLTSERRRAILLQQIRSLQPAWFTTLPPIAPVVWVQAVLHKAERLSRKLWLTSPDLIEQSIAGVRSVLSILDNARQLRDKLHLTLDSLVFRRAAISLDSVMATIGAGRLDDTAVQNIEARLGSFEEWLSNDRFPTVFWNEIAPSLQSLHNEIVVDTNIPDSAKELVTELKTAIETALSAPPATRADVEKAYEQYAKLRILWDERKDIGPFANLAKGNISELFQLADDRIWKDIKPNDLKIQMPVINDPDGLEAYDTLQFSVESRDTRIQQSYLFRHKVECHWTLTLRRTLSFAKKLRKRKPEDVVLSPVSLGPSVVQYFPRPGKVDAKVTLIYNGEEKEVQAAPGPTIHPSSDYAAYKILAATEVYSWLLAAVVAIATGISTYYFKGTSWGTYQDYLTLFLWGIGVDQGKNFLQALQSYGAQSSPATAGR